MCEQTWARLTRDMVGGVWGALSARVVVNVEFGEEEGRVWRAGFRNRGRCAYCLSECVVGMWQQNN